MVIYGSAVNQTVALIRVNVTQKKFPKSQKEMSVKCSLKAAMY